MSSLDRLTDLQESLDPNTLRRWLAAEGWALSNDLGSAEIWSSIEGRGIYGIKDILVPLRKDYSDYARRYRETLADLQMAYSLDLPGLLDQVAASSSDLFFVRMQQNSIDSTIPFLQATDLMTSIHKMVRAAATTAANPLHSHRGRRPAAVADFMDEDLRFGHTKRGSFIMTVASRLPEVARSSKVSDPDVLPFQRRVMQTLASGLVATKRLANSSEARDFDVEAAVEEGVSLELVQSIIDVSDFEGLKQVDLRFDWAKQGPTPPAFDEVSITAGELPKLEDVRSHLAREEPVDDVTIIGRVAELSRDEVSNGQEEMSVVVEADLFGRMRKIRVPLIDSDYEWAIYAHQRRLPFSVSGTPVKKRSWQLAGIVKADLSFLKDERKRRKD